VRLKFVYVTTNESTLRVFKFIPSLLQFFPGTSNQLWQSLCLANNWKKVCIVSPPGNNVLMQVSRDPSTSDFPLV
jgi:hypothetical protein